MSIDTKELRALAGLRAALGNAPDGSPESLARWAEYHASALWGNKSFPRQLSKIADTLREYAALEKDAARYRWLRLHSYVDSEYGDVIGFGPGFQQSSPNILDATIDAAIANKPAE
jgi:hypothetical protein